jgi:hypothetical protein
MGIMVAFLIDSEAALSYKIFRMQCARSPVELTILRFMLHVNLNFWLADSLVTLE